MAHAGAFLQDGGAQSVKVEGGIRSARTIEALVKAGIPVMGHIGLTPQAIHQIGKVRVQGKTREAARALLADALAVQEAGAFSIVLELVPEQLAAAITERLRIPTIGIGAGRRLCRPGPGHHRRPRAGRVRAASRTPIRSPARDDRPGRRGAWAADVRPARSRADRDRCAWTTRCSPRRSGKAPSTAREPSQGRRARAAPARTSWAASHSTATSRSVTRVLRTRAELRAALADSPRPIGLVPTMGWLHAGPPRADAAGPRR